VRNDDNDDDGLEIARQRIIHHPSSTTPCCFRGFVVVVVVVVVVLIVDCCDWSGSLNTACVQLVISVGGLWMRYRGAKGPNVQSRSLVTGGEGGCTAHRTFPIGDRLEERREAPPHCTSGSAIGR